MILPSMPQQWHVDLVRLGTKSSSPMKEIVTALENFEDYERKFDLKPNRINGEVTKVTITKTMTGNLRRKTKRCAECLDTKMSGKITT